MKNLQATLGALTAAFSLLATSAAFAADKKETPKEPAPAAAAKAGKPKAYPLKTCIVTDEKLGGDMGEPYVFAYKDREIKMCCKDCRKDFDKNPTKYIKKLEAEEKKAEKQSEK